MEWRLVVVDIQIFKERSVHKDAFFIIRESSGHSCATGDYFVGVLPVRFH